MIPLDALDVAALALVAGGISALGAVLRRGPRTTPDPAPVDDDAIAAQAVVDAIDDYADVLLAQRMGLAPDVVGAHMARAYDRLAALTVPQLSRALLTALEGEADDRARVLVNQFRCLPDTSRLES